MASTTTSVKTRLQTNKQSGSNGATAAATNNEVGGARRRTNPSSGIGNGMNMMENSLAGQNLADTPTCTEPPRKKK